MKIAVTALIACVPMVAWAGPREESRAGIARCDQLTDDRQWLDCVYGAVEPMRSRLGLPPAPEVQQGLVPSVSAAMAPHPATTPPAAPARQEGGFLTALVGDQDGDIRQPMTAYDFDQAGLFTVTLADGTVWRQLSTDGIRAGWRGPASGFVVRVSRGALGATSLTIAGTGTTYRVKQVK